MNNPSDGIARDLQSHVHLLSAYRFPLLPSVHPEKAAEWLISAPKIARDQSSFYWTYLDRPTDGTVFLVWQAGPEYPSDGYVWARPEVGQLHQVSGGYSIEVFSQKPGYGPGEAVATHCRYRYRLRQSTIPGQPPPDQHLWIVHYRSVESNERVPSQAIPVDMHIQNIMQTRSYLQSIGQVERKEFMLHDRANWPTIGFPTPNQRRSAPMYGGPQHQPRIPQSQAYPAQHPTAGPPAKRPRTQGVPPNSSAGGSAAHDDDEEDTSRGDLYDHTLPRDISIIRYKRNHEWMEEILSSPFAIHQIIPSDLGLGLRGELASLTEGFFDAPYEPDRDVLKYNYIGRLDPGKADEFRLRAAARIEETDKEIEKMKRKHARRMAKFQKGSILSKAEKELRTAVSDPTDVGPEYWRLEGRIDEEEPEEAKTTSKTPAKVSDIVARVEASLGRRAIIVEEVRRIQEGGFQEIVAPVVPDSHKSAPQSNNGITATGTPHSSVLAPEGDLDMGNSAASLLDQYPTSRTPGSMFSTPQAYLQTKSSTSTPGMHAPSPQPVAQVSPQPQAPAQGDTEMAHAEQAVGNDTGDWVVVPPGGVSPTGGQGAQQPAPAPIPAPSIPTPSPLPVTTSSMNTPQEYQASPNDFADLGDLDSAGDALAGYGDTSGDLGEMELDGMEDSAFGEAFHGTEARGEEQPDGM